MALPGLIPQIQSIANQIVQAETAVARTTSLASSLVQPNGINIPNASSITNLLQNVPGITSITSNATSFAQSAASVIGTVEGVLNSAVGTAQQLAGIVSSTVGAASALGLNPGAIGSIAQAFSTVNAFVKGGSVSGDVVPNFSHALNTSPSLMKFPLDLPEEGIRIAFAFKEYSRDYATQTPSYSDPTTIVLPVPLELMESYSVGYSEFSAGPLRSTGLFNNIAGAVGAEGNVIDKMDQINGMIAKNITDNRLDSWSTGLRAAMYYNMLGSGMLGSTVQKLGDVAQSPTVNSLVNNYFGNVINPSTTVSLTSVPLRKHRFSWTLTPKSKDESNMIESIFKELKTFTRPTITNGGFFLQYPMVCFPKIYKTTSDELYPFKPCFIDDITINHAGSGMPSFFYDTHNPTTYQMVISLHELEMFVNDSSTSNSSTSNASITALPSDDDLNSLISGQSVGVA